MYLKDCVFEDETLVSCLMDDTYIALDKPTDLSIVEWLASIGASATSAAVAARYTKNDPFWTLVAGVIGGVSVTAAKEAVYYAAGKVPMHKGVIRYGDLEQIDDDTYYLSV